VSEKLNPVRGDCILTILWQLRPALVFCTKQGHDDGARNTSGVYGRVQSGVNILHP